MSDNDSYNLSFGGSYALLIIFSIAVYALLFVMLWAGNNHKALLWTLYALSLLLFIACNIAIFKLADELSTVHKTTIGIGLFISFALNLAVLILTNNYGNLLCHELNDKCQIRTTNLYSISLLLVVLQFGAGLYTIHNA